MSDETPDAPESVEPAETEQAAVVTEEHAEEAAAESAESLESTDAPELPESPDSAELSESSEPVEEPAPRMEMTQLKAVIESLVFASPDPVTLRTLYKLLNDEPREDVKAALEALKVDYADRGGLHMAEVAGGVQITTNKDGRGSP